MTLGRCRGLFVTTAVFWEPIFRTRALRKKIGKDQELNHKCAQPGTHGWGLWESLPVASTRLGLGCSFFVETPQGEADLVVGSRTWFKGPGDCGGSLELGMVVLLTQSVCTCTQGHGKMVREVCGSELKE